MTNAIKKSMNYQEYLGKCYLLQKLKKFLGTLQPYEEVEKKVKVDEKLLEYINEVKKKLKIKDKPTPAQLEKLVESIIRYFDRRHFPIIQSDIKKLIKEEWVTLEKQLGMNLALGEAGKQYIERATNNFYMDEAVVEFNNQLYRDLTNKVLERDISQDQLVRDLKEVMDARESKLRMIAQTESTKAVNGARLLAYEEVKKPEDKYTWDIIHDSRTTGTCKRIAKRAKKGVTYDELLKIIQEESSKDYPKWIVDNNQPAAHYGCRSVLKLVRK